MAGKNEIIFTGFAIITAVQYQSLGMMNVMHYRFSSFPISSFLNSTPNLGKKMPGHFHMKTHPSSASKGRPPARQEYQLCNSDSQKHHTGNTNRQPCNRYSEPGSYPRKSPHVNCQILG